jgi:molybdenum cofactor synthesis domain-containing protein
MRTAAALIIGNELLSGKIAEGNLVVLARTLRPLGIQLRRVVMILDEIDVIAREVKELAATHDVVFTSGGVGPTHDDLTIEGVARAFDAGVAIAPELDTLLRAYYGERITEGHLLMARVPEGARLVTNGTVQWPTVVMKNVWVLPGVPEIFKLKMPLVREDLGSDTPFLSMAVFTDLDEGQIKELLDRVVATHASVEIGSYPKWNDPDYKTKLTFDGTDADRVRAARDDFAAGLPTLSVLRIE